MILPSRAKSGIQIMIASRPARNESVAKAGTSPTNTKTPRASRVQTTPRFRFVSAPVAAAGAALVVAVTFRPVHDAVQSLADRWLQPARHRAVIAVTAFVDSLRRGDTDVAQLTAAFRKALRDKDLTVLLELPDGALVDPQGCEWTDGGPSDEDRRRSLRIPSAGGTVALFRYREGDDRLATAVANAGALAIEIAALQVQLRRNLLEVEASRRRIQSVADEERRRIARDLHDGAQQRLIAIGLALRPAQLGADRVLGTAIDAAVAELTTSIEELRELAGGLRPGSLDEGLDSALRELAARTPVRLHIAALPERFPVMSRRRLTSSPARPSPTPSNTPEPHRSR